jgi:hypothetical protein
MFASQQRVKEAFAGLRAMADEAAAASEAVERRVDMVVDDMNDLTLDFADLLDDLQKLRDSAHAGTAADPTGLDDLAGKLRKVVCRFYPLIERLEGRDAIPIDDDDIGG